MNSWYTWAALTVAAVTNCDHAAAAEPRYQGRTPEQWAKELGGRNTFQARRAFKAFGSDGVPALATRLDARELNLRLDVINLLARQKRAAVPVLRKAMREKNQTVRENAVVALEMMQAHAAAAVPELTAALSARSTPMRQMAVLSLRHIGPKARPAIPALIAQVNDPSSPIRSKAATALGAVGRDARSAAVLAKAAGSDSRSLRFASLKALGTQTGPAVVKALTAALDDREMVMVRTAVDSLGRVGSPAKSALPRLRQLLTDPPKTPAGKGRAVKPPPGFRFADVVRKAIRRIEG